VVVLLLALGGFLLFLWLRNRYLRSLKTYKQKSEEKLTGWKLWVKIFFQFILIELISLVFTIVGIISLEQRTEAEWRGLDIGAIRIAFYVINVGLKYLLLIAGYLLEYKFTNIKMRITVYLGLRPDWLELLEGFVFIPSVIIDGFLVNAEFFVNDTGDLFDYDSIVLLVLDTILYIKFVIMFTLQLHRAEPVGYWWTYHVLAIMYSLLMFIYNLTVIFLLVLVHLNAIEESGMDVTVDMWLLIFNVVVHQYLSSYSSMVNQGITTLHRGFKQMPKLEAKQIRIFLIYFREVWYMMLINVVVYAVTYYMYAVVWLITARVATSIRDEVVLKIGIYMVLVLANVLNGFFMVNLIYGTLKRIGSWLRCSIQLNDNIGLDCRTYAKQINKIIAGRASFSCDVHMQIR